MPHGHVVGLHSKTAVSRDRTWYWHWSYNWTKRLGLGKVFQVGIRALCLCMCRRVSVCTHVGTCALVYVKGRGQTWCHSSGVAHLVFWDRLSPWPGVYGFSRLAGQRSPNTPLSLHQDWDYIDRPEHPAFLWMMGTKPGFSCLQQALHTLSHLPAPVPAFW